MSKTIPLEELVVGLATADDSDDLCRFFASVSMKTDLHLGVERTPHFFSLYNLQKVQRNVWIAKHHGKIEALGTMLQRAAWLQGEPISLGYAGDLRLSKRVRGGQFLGKVFGDLFEQSAQELGYTSALTAIIHSNKAAVSALVKRDPAYPRKPVYQLFRSFRIRNVMFSVKRRPRKSAYVVRRARSEDRSAIVEMLATDHRQRPFGYVFNDELLLFRLRTWPNFNIENFFLAWENTKLVGLVAIWDAHPVKRFRSLGYYGSMRWIRLFFNAGSWFSGYDRLPKVGDLFHYFYLTHQSILDDNPEVLAALVDTIYATYHGQGYQFFSTCVMDDDPLHTAFNPYRYTDIPAGLYVMTPAGTTVNIADLGSGRPGFEMALV